MNVHEKWTRKNCTACALPLLPMTNRSKWTIKLDLNAYKWPFILIFVLHCVRLSVSERIFFYCSILFFVVFVTFGWFLRSLVQWFQSSVSRICVFKGRFYEIFCIFVVVFFFCLCHQMCQIILVYKSKINPSPNKRQFFLVVCGFSASSHTIQGVFLIHFFFICVKKMRKSL